MTRFSLRTRLMVGLIAVVAVGLGVSEVATYYSVRSFMLKRVDEQVAAARGPAIGRLLVGDRFFAPAPPLDTGPSAPEGLAPADSDPGSTALTTDGTPEARGERGGGQPRGAPQNFTASLPPGTYAEVRFAEAAPRATSFGFDETYPIPALPQDVESLANGGILTVDAVDSNEHFRVSVTTAADGEAVLLVAVPMTEFDTTMDQLQLIGAGVTAGVLLLLAGLAFWLVRLGLRPLDEFAVTAANVAAGDMSQRMAVGNPRTEIGRLGTAMNEMLEDLEEAFRRRERSEEQLRRFLADASHELRTPLTSIRGYAELFGRGAQARPEDLEKVMNRITQQSERMSHIVEDLLLLARLDGDRPLERECVDITAIAGDVVEDARHRQPERLIRFAAPGPVVVTGDSNRLYQVVNNLVTNALTHTPTETEVDVSLRLDGAAAVIEVRDAGPGIEDRDRGHVFEPFYRASAGRGREHGGSGLGLAIVKAIVEAHDGSVSVEAAEPQGAAFAVRLPAAG
ncbi:MAG: HAMP domain-containing histidine kinase [Dehalococcoidia bacterium]|nr:HAMP domain-containing histidine kinase [Dehalococcoidia bacterium]